MLSRRRRAKKYDFERFTRANIDVLHAAGARKNTILNVLEGQKWVFCAPQAREKIRFGAFYKCKNGCLPAAGAKIFGVPSRKMDDPPSVSRIRTSKGGSSRLISADLLRFVKENKEIA